MEPDESVAADEAAGPDVAAIPVYLWAVELEQTPPTVNFPSPETVVLFVAAPTFAGAVVGAQTRHPNWEVISAERKVKIDVP